MKRVVLLGAVVALMAWAGTASAAAPPRSIDVTASANVTRIWNANSCCALEFVFDGTAKIPSLGRLKFTGVLDLVAHYVPPAPYLTSGLNMTFVAGNGDTFRVSGVSDPFGFDDPPPTAPWAISDATGRFSKVGGSGSYTVSGVDFGAETLTFEFVGTLAKG
jgi:hypothetical protein